MQVKYITKEEFKGKLKEVLGVKELSTQQQLSLDFLYHQIFDSGYDLGLEHGYSCK